METPLTIAIDIARQAGQGLLESFRQNNFQSRMKADHTIVTDADLASDRLITTALTRCFPGDAILSEEMQHHQVEEVQRNAVWVIDPLDGTTNFSLGLPIWGVLIARVVGGFTETAAMYFPLVDEMYTVQRGQGAFLNGKPLHIQPPGEELEMSFFACCSRTFRSYQVSIPYKSRILGVAAYSFCCLARSSAAVALEVRPHIWDIAGAWLLVKEAGGVIETLDNGRDGARQPFPIEPGTDYVNLTFATLAAPSDADLERARRQLVRIKK